MEEMEASDEVPAELVICESSTIYMMDILHVLILQ